jgi:hypothetical protein
MNPLVEKLSQSPAKGWPNPRTSEGVKGGQSDLHFSPHGRPSRKQKPTQENLSR